MTECHGCVTLSFIQRTCPCRAKVYLLIQSHKKRKTNETARYRAVRFRLWHFFFWETVTCIKRPANSHELWGWGSDPCDLSPDKISQLRQGSFFPLPLAQRGITQAALRRVYPVRLIVERNNYHITRVVRPKKRAGHESRGTFLTDSQYLVHYYSGKELLSNRINHMLLQLYSSRNKNNCKTK